jgi:hypothetical protein
LGWIVCIARIKSSPQMILERDFGATSRLRANATSPFKESLWRLIGVVYQCHKINSF